MPPPILGEHTDEVLREVLRERLELDEARVAKLRSEGVI
jgi:crotonobetainyl-CoA:carnitine CoA-transferase CaiB-like acyl-CoA transferase